MLVFGPALIFIAMTLFMTRSCEHKFETLENYGKITSFNFTDAKGNTRSSVEFEGDIVLITTIQESCPDSCSVLLWHINQMIYQRIWKNSTKKRKKVKIISFVTGNPVEDLSTVEGMLKNIVPNYDPSIWVLAKGEVKSLYNIEHNGTSLLQDGNKFLELMLLMDRKHSLRMVLSGKEEGHIRRMEQSMALLQKEYDKANSK
jgi:hypothetical protein